MNDAGCIETPVTFACAGERLLGIVARPQRAAGMGVVIVVGGPQYRIGSHRQFVSLSRCLARAGFAVLRFDHRGMGDSDGDARSFEDIDEDIGAAIDALRQACPEVASVALWGLCDAASAALLYWRRRRDARVAGLCLVNPWVRSEATLARARLRHYYGERALQREFWTRLLRGQARLAVSAADLWRNWRLARAAGATPPERAKSFRQSMAAALGDFPGAVLLVLSGRDATAQEFLECARSDAEWSGLLERPGLTRLDVPEADHTFTSAPARLALEQATRAWLERLAGRTAARPA